MGATRGSDAPLVIVGRIRRAHGIRGEVVVEPRTHTPDAVFAPGARVLAGTVTGDPDPAGRTLRVRGARALRDLLLVAFDEIPDRTEASRWRDRYLLVPGVELSPPAEHEVYVHDLVGLRVVDAGGTAVGPVIGTYEVAGRLLLEVQRPAGIALIPYELAFVKRVDLEAKELVMSLPEGLLD